MSLSTTEDAKNLIINSLNSNKADNINIIELGKASSLAEYVIFANGRSKRNVAAIAEKAADELKKVAKRNVRIEGLANAEWVMLDIGDIIVHIFHPESREYFKLDEHVASLKKDN